MAVRFELIAGAERAVVLRATRDRYERDLIESHAAPPGGAAVLADAIFSRYADEQVVPPDHFLFHIVSESDGENLGRVWLHHVYRGGWSEVQILDLWIRPEHRNLRYAQSAMALAEEMARNWGAWHVTGSVFGHNETMLNFCRTCGFAITGFGFSKQLHSSTEGSSVLRERE